MQRNVARLVLKFRLLRPSNWEIPVRLIADTSFGQGHAIGRAEGYEEGRADGWRERDGYRGVDRPDAPALPAVARQRSAPDRETAPA